MAGFLPPVVTTLTGDIDPLLAKLAEARKAIQALGDMKVTVPVNFDVNMTQFNQAMAGAATAAKKGVTAPLNFDPNLAGVARGMAEAQVIANKGITVPVTPDFAPFRGLGTQGAYWATQQLFRSYGEPQTNGFRNTYPTQYETPYGPGFYSSPDALWQANQRFMQILGEPSANTLFRNTFPLQYQPTYGPSGVFPYARNGRGETFLPFMGEPGGYGRGGGFWGSAFAGWAAANATRTGANVTPGWMGWLGGIPYAALHLGAYGALALGAGILGAGVDLASLGAVTGTGVANAYSAGSRLFSATEATIPPGVPDFALAKAFGLTGFGPNSPGYRASLIGNGNVIADYGGLLNIANGLSKNSGFLTKNGLNLSSDISNELQNIANRVNGGGASGVLQKFATLTTDDAANLGKTAVNLLSFLGHAAQHMPGEIEWLTTGLRNTSGWLNDLYTTPGLSQVMGAATWGFLLTHATGEAMSLGSKGLLKVLPKSLLKMPGRGTTIDEMTGMEVAAPEESTLLGSGLETMAGLSFAGLMTNPYVWAAAAATAGYLYQRRYQSGTSARINAINSGLYNVNTGTFSNNITAAMKNFANGAAAGGSPSGPGEFWARDILPALGFTPSGANFVSGGMYNRTAPNAQQYGNALYNAQQAFLHYGRGEDAVAAALGLGNNYNMAGNLMSLAGVKMGANRRIVGGLKRAVQLVNNFIRANSILNGTRGETLANMSIAGVVGDSAWTQASTINSNWDTFMSALTSGGGSLSGVLTSLGKTPSGNLAKFFNTTAAIGSSSTAGAEQLIDFFRQAQSVGAITANKIPFASIAASLAPIAGKSKAAQADLIALANEGGTSFKTLAQVMAAGGGTSSAALQRIINATQNTTIAMAKVPAAAQKTMTQVSSDISNEVAGIIGKSAQAYNALNNLTTVMQKYGTGSRQAGQAAQALIGPLEKNGMSAFQVALYFQQLGINSQTIAQDLQRAHTPASEMSAILAFLAASADKATSALNRAADAWAGIKSGTKVLTVVNQDIISTIYAGYKGGSAAQVYAGEAGGVKAYGRGHAFGGRNLLGQWSWVGEKGPELMYLPNHSSIIPAYRAAQMMSTMTGMGNAMPEVHAHVYLDGKEVFNATRRQTYQYNIDNGNRGTNGRVKGTMAPR